MKKLKWGFILLAAAAIVAVSGCGKKEIKPVDIVEGVDKCEICNMTVANDQYATEVMTKDGKAHKFDDIGDLFVWTKKNGLNNVEARFVRDYHSKEWIKLEDASYVYDKSFKTPMAFGVVSFKEKKDAEAFVAEQKTGKLMSAADLDTHTWEPNRDQMKMGGHGDGKSGGMGNMGDAGAKNGH